jgi:pimeloyl-ACP methyl ester carboxylesterase
VSAADLAFIDGLWRDWSPGYPGAADAALAKDCLRSPASLTAAIGYYRAMFDPARQLPRYAAEQAAVTAGGGCPVLYLHGAADGCLGVTTAAHAAEFLPAGSRCEVIDGVGHFLHLERPDLINARVAEWLR